MAALRVGATLAHALPGLRLRLRDPHGHTLLEVGGDGGPGATRVVTPCAFRTAVGHAQQRIAAGSPLRFLGLPLAHAPAVDVGVPPGGRAFGVGLYAVPIAGGGPGTVVQAFATTLAPDVCRRVVRGAHPAMPTTVRVLHDETTDVTVVHGAVPTEDALARPSPVLADVLAVVATEEVVAGCSTSGTFRS